MRFLIILIIFFSSTFIYAQVRPAHTVILILENHGYGEIAGNPQAPYLNSILNDNHTAKFTQSFALTHPSQPNYLMLFSGSNQGVGDDNVPSTFPFTAPNLGESLLQAGFSFTGYSEDLPTLGFNGAASGAYVRKHNPWVNWQDGTTNGIPSAFNRPFTDFPSDFTMLPTVSIVVPNLNHDMHDGTVSDCDTWVQTNLSACIQWCENNNGLFIITFDEDDASANNQILTSLTGNKIQNGSYNQRITHYNVLRTIEELYKLPYAGVSGDSTAIQNIWLTILPVASLQFNATTILNTVSLQWQTSEEHGAKSFIVERSVDNTRIWNTIAELPAAGNSNTLRKYDFIDAAPANGINLYRIKQLDLDNNFIYSGTIAVRVGKMNDQYRIFPNPSGGLFYIISAKNESEEVTVTVKDISGKLIRQVKYSVNIATLIQLNLTGESAGIYFITIDNGKEKTMQKILVH